jgi:predicted CXXCH cytochrome family protein
MDADERPAELEPAAEQEQREEDEGRLFRRIGRVIAVLVLVVLLFIVADILVVRGPGEREFIARNIECLRCHTEMITKAHESKSVHQPFLAAHCTSCHTPHVRIGMETTRPGDFSAWEWLHQWLERAYLGLFWQVFSGNTLVTEIPAGRSTDASGTAWGKSNLVQPEERLCWMCHGGLGYQLTMSNEHPPFEKGQCTSCHDPHASMVKPVLKGETVTLCVSCHRVYDELLASDIHPPFGQLQCTSCHHPHASNYRGMTITSQRELCFGCHPSVATLTSESVQHSPFEHGECTGCHRPHSSTARPLLITYTPELCFNCHGGVRPEFALNSHHPLGRVDCPDCHVPHAGSVNKLLPAKQKVLCLGCHKAVGTELSRLQVHMVVDQQDCTTCHLPHGSDVGPLLQEAQPELCYRCHGRVREEFAGTVEPFSRKEQPVQVAKEGETLDPTASAWSLRKTGLRPPTSKGDPVIDTFPTASGSRRSAHPVPAKLVCTDCHEAHGSDFLPLLVDARRLLCLRCHSGNVPVYGFTPHKDLECLRCHGAHGSPYPSILVKDNPKVCVRCHTGYDTRPYNHPSTADFYDNNSSKPLSCTSSCHSPHGSANFRMLRVPYAAGRFGTDFVCLICHTKVGIAY